LTQQKLEGLQEGLNRLLKGEYRVLLESAISSAIPDTVLRLIDLNKHPAADKLIEQMASASRSMEKDVRAASSACLVATAQKLASAGQWDRLDKIVPALKTISGSPVFSDQIRADAQSSIQMAETRQTAVKPPAPKKEAPKDPLALREEQIFQLAAKGNTDVAKKQLFDLVVSCARKKDFANAERLRERIYEIDPMALMEIIQSGDIIEEEKSEAISTDHLDIWKDLLTVLSTEEFNALYHEMETRTFKPGEIVVSQGAENDELFFINHGGVRVSYTGGVKELFFKNIGSGEIAGDNFFNPSVWTVSLTAQQQTAASVLRRNSLARLEEQKPGIESKLINYYNRTSDLYAAMEKKGMDRRVHERYKLERKVHLQIVDNKDRILSSFNGILTDVSLGGLSFYVRITKKENSRLLLGRNIKISIPTSSTQDKVLRGSVIGTQIYDLMMSDYSVHVRFEEELERSQLKIILD